MKDSCCTSKSGISSWFCPSIVSVVVGVIMITAGASKFLGGATTMAWVGGSVLGVFNIDTSAGALAMVALVLGYTAATIELVGGLSFALGCKKTIKYAALGLAIVLGIALLTKFQKIEIAPESSAFESFSAILTAIRLDLLLLAIFIQKFIKSSCCKSSCCETQKSCCSTTVEKSCCGGGKC